MARHNALLVAERLAANLGLQPHRFNLAPEDGSFALSLRLLRLLIFSAD